MQLAHLRRKWVHQNHQHLFWESQVKRQLTISDTSDSDTPSVRKCKRMLKKKTSQTIVEKVRNTEGFSENERQDIGEISTRSSSEWTENPKNLPREMTVLQAENEKNSDTE